MAQFGQKILTSVFFWGVYPLVNCHITMENPPFFMGKSTISMAIFNSFLYVYQAGYPVYPYLG